MRRLKASCLPAPVTANKIPNVVSHNLSFETTEGVPVHVLGVDHLAQQHDLGDLSCSTCGAN
jgi:hypothetical protein